MSSTCEEFNFRGWYDAAFRLGQETHQILFEFQQTRWASRSKSCSRSRDVSSLALYRRRIPNRKFACLYAIKNCQVLVKNWNFVADMTRRFVSAKRLIRYFSNCGKLVEHRVQSPVCEVKMLSGKKFQELAHKTGSWQFIKQVLMMLVTSKHIL